MLLADADPASLGLVLAVLSLAIAVASLLVSLRKLRVSPQPLPSPKKEAPKGVANEQLKAELTAAAVAELRRAAREQRVRVLLVLGSLALTATVAEIGLRYFARESLHLDRDERTLMHRYDEVLGWFPIPYTHERTGAARAVSVTHNGEGFRDWDHPPSDKPALAFVGDSFVWGYDVEASERFTDKLQARHPEWNIFNFGISGYGTDQELLLLERIFDQYKPRLVFLVFSTETDRADNASNVRYGGYYKPYFTLETNQLRLKGVPVPQCEKVFWSEHPRLAGSYLARLAIRAWYKLASPPALINPDPTEELLRQMQNRVQSRGAEFLVGLTRGEPKIEEYLTKLRVSFVNLSTPLRYPKFGQHWTPAGHSFVAGKIDEFLRTTSHAAREQKGGTP